MKVLFHTNTLNYRGTAVAVADYAKYNQDILGNESVISFDSSIPYEKDMGTEPAVVERLSHDFNLIPHNGSNLQQIIDDEKIDIAYFLRSGNRDWVPDNCQTAIHAVFQLCDPYGDRYAYISSWLADIMNQRNNKSIPYVPHMINLPNATANYRELLNIGRDKTIVGRIGGYYTFNLPWVKEAIVQLLEKRDDIVFVMVGTEPWINHPNVRFQSEIHDLQTKTNFINTCDAMIHARSNGESFGLAICESLALNKPVLAWEAGDDRHHTQVLKNSGLLYNQFNVLEKLNNIHTYISAEDWTQRIAEFRPAPVIAKFKEVFL